MYESLGCMCVSLCPLARCQCVGVPRCTRASVCVPTHGSRLWRLVDLTASSMRVQTFIIRNTYTDRCHIVKILTFYLRAKRTVQKSVQLYFWSEFSRELELQFRSVQSAWLISDAPFKYLYIMFAIRCALLKIRLRGNGMNKISLAVWWSPLDRMVILVDERKK